MKPSSLLLALPLSLLSAESALCREQDQAEATEEVPTASAQGGHERLPLPSAEEIAALPPDGGPEFNRLIFEESPYLLQHARNPVDWYPWGEEAFRAAREQDKPIFLSIGYSTCHWCHVMEKESFEDDDVAALLNAGFICIKVDREERPDLDHVFMSVTQALTGSGGWPMTVVMTPDQEPFLAGTYFPKTGRFGRPGMMELLPKITQAWRQDRTNILKSAKDVSNWMKNIGTGNPGEDLGPEVLDLAYQRFAARFDATFGGFGSEPPKFPVPHNLLFLMRYSQRAAQPHALEMALETLRAMRRGGIYDQIGYGFHRYSTDQRWLVPHFEKMLYDQALHTMAYTAAWQLTGEATFEETAREVIEYVLRDMTSPEGGFYSAEDADSEGVEGLFYLWTRDEIDDVLGKEDADLFAKAYGIREDGNFRDEASGESVGRNIPHLVHLPREVAAEKGIDAKSFRGRIERMREKLFAAREERVHPLKDDKILTDWNGLMIAALARAAQAFGDDEYAEAARAAAEFALANLVDDKGRLMKRYRAGRAGLPGTLDDYAFLSFGLIELYETTFEVRYLEAAIAITDQMIAHFADEKGGGFFLSADDGDELLGVRGKEAYDGAIPAGNSIAAWNLLRLARITGRTAYEERAAGCMRSFSKTVARSPTAHTQLLAAVDFSLGPTFEVVIAGDPGAADTKALVRAFHARFAPNKVLLLRPPGETPAIARIAPFTKDQVPGENATAFVCRDYTCKLPTSDVEKALSFLDPDAW
ncbi:MAG TPA: thioredoxin domain-containing protein [Planctomycetes bacterium]|nr:thioredoxin domain-containing protein [Planctomycetota bacterium]